MRVLVVSTAYPLPVRDGLRLQLAGVLRELRRHHEVVLVAQVAPGDDLAAADELCSELVPVRHAQTRVRRLRDEVATLRSGRPVLAQQVTASPLGAAAAAAAERTRPDVVHLSPGWTAELAPLFPAVPVVLAPLDATGPNWAAEAAARGSRPGRWLTRREGARLLRFEQTAYAACDGVVVVTDRDAHLLRAGDGRLQPDVVTNGVDAPHWSRPAGAVREPGLVVLSGAMSYAPNVEAAVFAAQEVLPLLQQRHPGARLRLVGRDPAPEVLALAGPDVEVTGTVGDLRPHLWAAAAYLCPMRSGAGVKNKLLEALAASAPCIATPLALNGLALVDGRDVLTASTADELAEATARVLADPALQESLGNAAAARAAELSWGRAAGLLVDVYERVVAERAAPSR